MIEVGDIWTVAGVLVGFEAASFAWRVQREATVGDQNCPTWLPLADYLNLLGLLVVGLGVFALPVLNVVGETTIGKALGLGVVLWIGHVFALAGHYELYNPNTPRSMAFCPCLEKVALCGAIVAAGAYFLGVVVLG